MHALLVSQEPHCQNQMYTRMNRPMIFTRICILDYAYAGSD